MKEEVRQQYLSRIAAFAKQLKPDGLRLVYRITGSILGTQKIKEKGEGK